MPLAIPIPILSAALPELLMAGLICLIFGVDLFTPRAAKMRVGVLSLLGLLVVAAVTLAMWNQRAETFSGMFLLDGYALFFKLIFLAVTSLSILISLQYLKVEDINFGEYYGLMLFATLGMMIMAAGGDLISIYLGLELMSISIYVLVGFMKKDPSSQEAALKYFLLGAFTSAILLYGMALTYGLTGSTNLKEIAGALKMSPGFLDNPALTMAIVLVVVGFGFKIALVPFHMWAPDAYHGAPTSITAYMSVGVKAAAFAGLVRILLVGFSALDVKWNVLLWVLSAFSMTWGNVAAIAQTNIKRMLAYSSIAHAGYLLIGVVAGGRTGLTALLFYLAVYIFMNIGAFSMVILLCREGFRGDRIEDFQGLARVHPVAGLAFVVFFLSLAGIPPTAGFVAKLYIFGAAIEKGYVWLALIGVLNSAISVYYYFRVVMLMYMCDLKGIPRLSRSKALIAALLIMVGATFLLGVFPGPFIEAARASVMAFL